MVFAPLATAYIYEYFKTYSNHAHMQSVGWHKGGTETKVINNKYCLQLKKQMISTAKKVNVIATGVRPEDCKQKQANVRTVISCCVFDIC